MIYFNTFKAIVLKELGVYHNHQVIIDTKSGSLYLMNKYINNEENLIGPFDNLPLVNEWLTRMNWDV